MHSKISKNIQELFEKDLTRKEFLKYLGSLLLMLTGVLAVINAVTNPLKSNGYGGSVYGGEKK